MHVDGGGSFLTGKMSFDLAVTLSVMLPKRGAVAGFSSAGINAGEIRGASFNSPVGSVDLERLRARDGALM